MKPFKPNLHDKQRFSAQADRILGMLTLGPVYRSELVEVARNVTARISQLRSRGYEIKCTRVNAQGETLYQLVNA